MLLALPTHRRGCRARLRKTRLHVESLETRNLLSGTPLPHLEAVADDTLNLSRDLGHFGAADRTVVDATIGDGAAGPADVDWYQFTLDQPAVVQLTLPSIGGNQPLAGVLSLYNNDEFDFGLAADPLSMNLGDLAAPNGHRLLARDEGAGQSAIVQTLAAGTYFVAVSGAGNVSFNPFLADSGYAGSTGAYELQIRTGDAGVDPFGSPVVLSTDPGEGAVLDHAPSGIRVEFSAMIGADPGVSLAFSPSGDFAHGSTTEVPLRVNVSSTVNELLVTPLNPLLPGSYRLTVPGSHNPDFLDFTTTFQIRGIEGRPATAGALGGDDTRGTAHELGNVTNAGLVQASGIIGDDPFYANFDAADYFNAPANPTTNDVDLFHFQVSGPGRYALRAEAFAQRIGSPLDPVLSLFQRDTDGTLQWISTVDNTGNTALVQSSQVTQPLYFDAALFAGLTEGDYYVAVSSAGNAPDPVLGYGPGSTAFNPNIAHNGQGGFTTGSYVLNVQVDPMNGPLQVIGSSPSAGDVLSAPPTQFVVKFNEPADLQQLAYQAYLQTASPDIAAVFVLGANGRTYHPRLRSINPATNEATFDMLDGLPNGVNELHLSGRLGLADFGGNPLAGNDPGGDYVIRFTVNGPVRGINGDPQNWSTQRSIGEDHPQALGVLFPNELQNGIRITRDFTRDPSYTPSGSADYYQFQVLQSRGYNFALPDVGLPGSVSLKLIWPDGQAISSAAGPLAHGLNLPSLDAGTYTIEVGGWTAAQAAQTVYHLTLSLDRGPQDPPPLTTGAAPALRIRLATITPPPSPASPPSQSPPVIVLTSPGDTGGTVTPATSTSTGSLPTVANIPSGVLTALAAGPVGGVRGTVSNDTTAPSDRAFALNQHPPASGLLRLLVLTQPAESGTSTDEINPVSSWQNVENYLRGLGRPLDRLLDLFFGMETLLKDVSSAPRDFRPATSELAQPSADDSSEEGGSAEDSEVFESFPSFEEMPLAGTPTARGDWGSVLAIAGLFGVLGSPLAPRPQDRKDRVSVTSQIGRPRERE